MMPHVYWDHRTNAWAACCPRVTDASVCAVFGIPAQFPHGGRRLCRPPICFITRFVAIAVRFFSRSRQHPDALHMAHAVARRKKHHLTYLHSESWNLLSPSDCVTAYTARQTRPSWM